MKTPERSCGNKMQLTRAQAFDIVEHVRGRSVRTGNFKHHSFNAYRCEFCGWWHTGHDSATKQTKYKRPPRNQFFRQIENESE